MTDPRGGPVGPASPRRARTVPGPRSGIEDTGPVSDGVRPDDDGGAAYGTDAADGAPAPGGRAAARASARAEAHSKTGRAANRRKGKRAKRPTRLRRTMKIAGISLSVLLIVTAGAGYWLYQHLNGNINSVSLTDGVGKDSAGQETPDEFGRTPINILVMGSDGRTSEEDCALGGGCSTTGVQTGQNADVEMVVHISADRSNATVMSIPRDTEVKVPACTDPKTGAHTAGYTGMINGALAYGPACQVATVHDLTGIPIDHFIQLDFSGVVDMSDAVGGVAVCVDADVYDTYSHLKLSKGSHTLKGDAALEFLRSRHGFGDGSDLGRTYSQHIFLSAMIRKLKSAGTLTNPTAVYKLADAATKALTVDDGLGSITKLVGLASDVAKISTSRMTFTTMQTAPDPSDVNRVIVGAGAQELFNTIANDQSLSAAEKTTTSTASASASATPSPTATAVPASQVTVTVENGTSISGRASTIATALTSKGFNPATTSANAPAQSATTVLTYGPGQKDEAQTAAGVLGLSSSHLKQGTADGLVLVVGADWPSGTVFPGATSTPAPADTNAAVSGSHAQTADDSNTCAEVSKYKTVEINGVAMTPSEAYAESPTKKDSDKS